MFRGLIFGLLCSSVTAAGETGPPVANIDASIRVAEEGAGIHRGPPVVNPDGMIQAIDRVLGIHGRSPAAMHTGVNPDDTLQALTSSEEADIPPVDLSRTRLRAMRGGSNHAVTLSSKEAEMPLLDLSRSRAVQTEFGKLTELLERHAALLERSERLLTTKERHFEMALPCLFGMCAGGFGFMGMWVTFIAFRLFGPYGRLGSGYRREGEKK